MLFLMSRGEEVRQKRRRKLGVIVKIIVKIIVRVIISVVAVEVLEMIVKTKADEADDIEVRF